MEQSRKRSHSSHDDEPNKRVQNYQPTTTPTPRVSNPKFQAFLDFVWQHKSTSQCAADHHVVLPWLAHLARIQQLGNFCIPQTRDTRTQRQWLRTKVDPSLSDDEDYILGLAIGKLRIRVDHRTVGRERRAVVKVHTTNLKEALTSCGSAQLAVLDVSIELANGGKSTGRHSNAIVVDMANRTYERFEPHGASQNSHTKLEDQEVLDSYLVSAHFKKTHLPAGPWHYITPFELCPRDGPQIGEWYPPHCAPGSTGYCVVYSAMYLHLRLLLPELTPVQIHDLLLVDLTKTELMLTVFRYAGAMESQFSFDPRWSGPFQNMTAALRRLVSPTIANKEEGWEWMLEVRPGVWRDLTEAEVYEL